MPRSGSSMVGDKKKQNKTTNLVKLEASLAPAEAEVGAVAKADQYLFFYDFCSLLEKIATQTAP